MGLASSSLSVLTLDLPADPRPGTLAFGTLLVGGAVAALLGLLVLVVWPANATVPAASAAPAAATSSC